jgi:hypothetical protein
MDTQQIVTIARSGTTPAGWFVWHLRRDWLGRQALSWAALSLFGFALLVPTLITTVPYNFQHGTGRAVFAVLLFIGFGVLALGGLYLLVSDLLRLTRADRYLLVMTPDDYVKVEPRRVTHISMDCVSYVTLKGVKLLDDPRQEQPQRGFNRLIAPPRREPRRAPSLAFLDSCTRREVLVSRDNAYDELAVLDEILRTYARGRG